MNLDDISIGAFVKFCREVREYQNTVRGEIDVSKLISKRVRKFLINKGEFRYIDLDDVSFQSLSFNSIKKLMMFSVKPRSKAEFLDALNDTVHFPLPKCYILSENSFELFFEALRAYAESFKEVVDFLSFEESNYVPSLDRRRDGLLHMFVNKIPFDYGYTSLAELREERFGTVEEMIRIFLSSWTADRIERRLKLQGRLILQLHELENIRHKITKSLEVIGNQSQDHFVGKGQASASVYQRLSTEVGKVDGVSDINKDVKSAVNDLFCEHFKLSVSTDEINMKALEGTFCGFKDQTVIRDCVEELLPDEPICLSIDVTTAGVDVISEGVSTDVSVSDQILFVHDRQSSSEIVDSPTQFMSVLSKSSYDLKFPHIQLLADILLVDASAVVVDVGVPLLNILVKESHTVTVEECLERDDLSQIEATLDGHVSFKYDSECFLTLYKCPPQVLDVSCWCVDQSLDIMLFLSCMSRYAEDIMIISKSVTNVQAFNGSEGYLSAVRLTICEPAVRQLIDRIIIWKYEVIKRHIEMRNSFLSETAIVAFTKNVYNEFVVVIKPEPPPSEFSVRRFHELFTSSDFMLEILRVCALFSLIDNCGSMGGALSSSERILPSLEANYCVNCAMSCDTACCVNCARKVKISCDDLTTAVCVREFEDLCEHGEHQIYCASALTVLNNNDTEKILVCVNKASINVVDDASLNTCEDIETVRFSAAEGMHQCTEREAVAVDKSNASCVQSVHQVNCIYWSSRAFKISVSIFRVKAKDKIDRIMLVIFLLSANCHSIISLIVAMFLLVESVKCVNLSRVSIYDSGYVVKLLLHKEISYCSCITGAKASCTDCLQTIALNRMSTFNYLLIRICFFSVWSCCFYLLFYLNFAGEMFLTLMMM